MMIYPPINELLKTVDCRYTLVVETAKRARQLVSGDPQLTEEQFIKPVSIAIQEIYEGKVTCERREGLK
ncbi:DNA-directed RNA polymerase subunit omega [Christensenella sp. MSJ-20]|uniref:DNA-directed RNA polymerase subunit omega n=1 Tax=Christensenella sp. MSJ-20 TaxID=2841518 RepID=UPI0037BE4B94